MNTDKLRELLAKCTPGGRHVDYDSKEKKFCVGTTARKDGATCIIEEYNEGKYLAFYIGPDAESNAALAALSPNLARRVIELEEGIKAMSDKLDASRSLLVSDLDPFCLIEEIDAAAKKLLQED